jgi:hypothetical protein
VTLRDLQLAMQGAIMAGAVESDDPVLKRIRASSRADRETLLGVYVAAYRLRLAEFLQVDYPALQKLVGEEAFDEIVEDYISSQPSQVRNARWYSSRLPEFLTESCGERDPRALSLANFERALTDAFDAPDAPALPLETLAGLPPTSWPSLAFEFHPSLRLLTLTPGAVAAHAAYVAEEEKEEGEEEAATGEEAAESGPVAVWRSEGDAVYRELDDGEYLALNEAKAGRSFGEICQMVAFAENAEEAPQRLAQFLASWFSDGLIVALREKGAESE